LAVKQLLVLAFAVLGVANSAFAADLPVKAPPVVTPVPRWTGFYVGAEVGGAWTNNLGAIDPQPLGVGLLNLNVGPPVSSSASGVIGGPFAGFNYQFAPRWVTGVEASWSWTSLSGSSTQPLSNGGGTIAPQTFATSSKLDSMGSLRGRLGYLVTPNLLAYGTAGVALGKFDYAATTACPLVLCGLANSTTASSTQAAPIVGGGVEAAITREYHAGVLATWTQFNNTRPPVAGLATNAQNAQNVFSAYFRLQRNFLW
jgi:outer membrane immunogenic protein